MLVFTRTKHTAKKVKHWLNDSTSQRTKDWPPNSPDLNLIKNVWTRVKASVHENMPPDRISLKRAIKKAIESWQ